MSVRFWGVRGTLPTPGGGTTRYGGETSCVEVRCGGRILIIDAGTGLRRLGAVLEREESGVDADIFFSHYHMDHILGFPFFRPAYAPQNRLTLWSSHSSPETSLVQALNQLMSPPLFPATLDAMRARLAFRSFQCGETLTPYTDIAVRTAPLRHPGGATGYRIECRGKAVAYVCDTEHVAGALDKNVLSLADHADLIIYDATYTDDEYRANIGWGHSTWREGIRIAEAASAKMLALFHHAPDHDDVFMDSIACEAAAARSNTIVAHEGLCLKL